MEKLFYTRLTTAGERKFAAAAVSGQPVNFTEMAVGDGGGVLPDPSRRDGLVNERYRSQINRVVIADQGANVIRVEMIMLPQFGGFWLREAALYDDEGVCLAVANMAPTYKPLLAEGSGRLQSVNMWISVSKTSDVTIKADPTVILATVEEVNRAESAAKDYADNLAGQLENMITEAIGQAKRDAWEEDNPPGTTRFFNQNLNPNERWPWSKWVYTGENKTIRVGKSDGSNVGATGGSDTITIQRANLPAEQVNISGNTSNVVEQKLRTGSGGGHRHQGGMVAPGEVWDANYIVGSDNDSRRTRNYTSTDGEHDHEYTIPGHGHNISGKTENLGEGKTINVVEAHTLLMCWSRVA